LDIDTFRGVTTAVLMVLFVALVIFAYGKKQRAPFDEAARLPLSDDRAPPARREERPR
jgi:cytochrome c oxidase cbb3-type subunit 4